MLKDDEFIGLPQSCLDKLRALRGQTVLVTGGCGFVGRHIVFQLLQVGAKVRVFEVEAALKNERTVRYPEVEYIGGNVTEKNQFLAALAPGPAGAVYAVIHVASPSPTVYNPELFHNVNVNGTKNVIQCCLEAGVKRLVYTSSASVVFDGRDQKALDEDFPPLKALDAYTKSKLGGEEAVLAAGRAKQLATCAIRPHAIFGPRDPHFLPALAEVGRNKKSKYQIGDGTNLVDYTYVENVAYGHTLAAATLFLEHPANGKAYFITNREPVLFWDFVARFQSAMGWPVPSLPLPFTPLYYVGCAITKLGIKSKFTRQSITYSGCYHYYSCEKAVQDLGYEPAISLDEAVRRTIEYAKKFNSSFFNEEKLKQDSKGEEKSASSSSSSSSVSAADSELLKSAKYGPPSALEKLWKGWLAILVVGVVSMGMMAHSLCKVACALWALATGPLSFCLLFWTLPLSLLYLYTAWQVLCETPMAPFGITTRYFTEKPNLANKNIVVTGGNKGIGYAVSLQLTKLGANVTIASRDEGRAKDAVARIRAEVGASAQIDYMLLDLDSFSSIKKFVSACSARKASGWKIDVLVNNAGLMNNERKLTPEGIEQVWQVNYLAQFLLTQSLLKAQCFASDARIVNVSSLSHWQGNMNLSDVEGKDSYNAYFAYCQSKLAQILYTRELATRLKAQGSNIAVLAVHPGVVETDFIEHFKIPFARQIVRPFVQTIAQSAHTVVYAAVSREMQNVTGQYISNSAIGRASGNARDPVAQKLLWKLSEDRLAGHL